MPAPASRHLFYCVVPFEDSILLLAHDLDEAAGAAGDGDGREAGGREVALDLLDSVGVHTADDVLPGVVPLIGAVGLVDYHKAAAGFEDTEHLAVTVHYVGPEIDGLEGGDKIETFRIEG